MGFTSTTVRHGTAGEKLDIFLTKVRHGTGQTRDIVLSIARHGTGQNLNIVPTIVPHGRSFRKMFGVERVPLLY